MLTKKRERTTLLTSFDYLYVVASTPAMPWLRGGKQELGATACREVNRDQHWKQMNPERRLKCEVTQLSEKESEGGRSLAFLHNGVRPWAAA